MSPVALAAAPGPGPGPAPAAPPHPERLKLPPLKRVQRSVSFHLDDDDPPPPSPSPRPGTPLRSALKPTASAYRRLPPPEQFQHPDPLLRRLRLVDAQGTPVSLRSHFDSRVNCVGFYFSSEWAGQPLKQYDQMISEFSRRHADEFKVVYVSIDVDEAWYKAGIKGTSWVSMVWDDGSNTTDKTTLYPAERRLSNSRGTGTKLTEAPSTKGTENESPGGEDFLCGGEVDIDASLARTDASGQAYMRPFSRVHLANKLNITSVPTLTVYHLPSRRMIEWNVPLARLHGSADPATWAQWRAGQSTSTWATLTGKWLHHPPAIVMRFRWVFLLLALAMFHWFGGASA